MRFEQDWNLDSAIEIGKDKKVLYISYFGMAENSEHGRQITEERGLVCLTIKLKLSSASLNPVIIHVYCQLAFLCRLIWVLTTIVISEIFCNWQLQ